MKHLLMISALLVSSLAIGQWPSLPYNPDDNADGLIGVADLQALLANYGSEFASAVVSEDGESAIVYMGDMAYPLCFQTCKNLPGIWQLPLLEDLGLVWDDVHPTTPSTVIKTWLTGKNIPDHTSPYYYGSSFSSGDTYQSFVQDGGTSQPNRCYCAAKQLPRVEFYKCVGNGSDAVEECVNCVSTKLSEGWQLLPPGGSSVVQDLWRWAE